MNKMSFKLMIAPLILSAAFGLSGCNEEESPAPTPEPPITEPSPEPTPVPPAPEPEVEPPKELIAGDPVRGKQASIICSACHSFQENASPNQKFGPPLFGVFDRDIAAVEGYEYSGVLENIEGTWDEERLEQFLKSPQSFASGSKMAASGLSKEEQVKDVIAYLKTLKNDTPATLSAPAPKN